MSVVGAGVGEELLSIAKAARLDLERRRVDARLLTQLYAEYNHVPELASFVEQALAMFPRLCCGLASVYLRHRLGEGTVAHGLYGRQRHTFLVARRGVVDITADQFGGPAVYVGPIVPPWRRLLRAGRQSLGAKRS